MCVQIVQVPIVFSFIDIKIPLRLGEEVLFLVIKFSQRYATYVGNKIVSVEGVVEKLGSDQNCSKYEPMAS